MTVIHQAGNGREQQKQLKRRWESDKWSKAKHTVQHRITSIHQTNKPHWSSELFISRVLSSHFHVSQPHNHSRMYSIAPKVTQLT